MAESLKFTVVDAFTNKPFGGNPAAVIVLPSNKTIPDSTLQGIALEFNLSETAFISVVSTPPEQSAQHVSFGLRWFTPATEVLICGHATLASASVLFADTNLVPAHANEIRFSTISGTMIARRVAESTKIELEFPVGDIVQADQELTTQATKAIQEAINVPNASVAFVGVCSVAPYKQFLLVDLDSPSDISSLTVNAALLERNIPSHPITVLTTQNKSNSEALAEHFQVRVFANALGIPEDPVTGSANSFAAKYWARKSGTASGQEFATKQVSARVGDLGIVWEEKTGTAKLRGETRVASRGEIYL